ncbi:gluconate 2-dehydrogenase subunit 3 family protein [Mucilaginibacter sp. UR6-11]|uniref:gluconate 2-dehydrogenase subunit 3 family protein n=1 Tax=Mucilaginibacter sp. UR6-11 TaxID=1435644 RepID=UPI001E400FB9|nr:gluconate 2-dehydrogenase subunit 3 family protein [Mucilaginibacter sp. UR6-11]MCC8423767.1 gluconate 2-dehydrogenase subunit 3 family protein [Mucilaginibacter sp. UR6-11]
MNRKAAIKSILAVVTLGVSSGALYEFLKPADIMPVNLLPQKKALIADLAELIIPRTDTPGAKDAMVEDYIIKMITENTDPRSQKIFLTGLSSLEHYTFSNYNKSFISCSLAQKTLVLKHFEDKANYSFAILNKVNKKVFGLPFFYQLRDLTVEGYCTSFLGATKGMAYDYIPANFESCIPLKKGQLAWATK